jgi:3-hydroxybutyryl-CoA dehydrogenase
MKTAGIIGAGTMGSGIAQVAAAAGWSVLLFDAQAGMAEKALQKISGSLQSLSAKGKITESEAADISGRILAVNSLSEFHPCNLVIEAIVENPAIKNQLFRELEDCVSPECILASNTSSLSIASLAAVCRKPDRFIGIHFFNPATIMKLVEIIPAVQTSDVVRDQSLSIIQSWGKTTVLAKDTPGFIVNRVARPFYGEALRIYDEGIADMATIDHAMKSLGRFPMGPFELMDFIGHDVNYVVTETVFHAFFCDPRYMPSFSQKRLMEAGFLGRKSGRGFYDYREGAVKPAPKEEHYILKPIFDRILAMLINEAAEALHYGIAGKEDIDTAMTKGVNYPNGLLAWADEIGAAKIVDILDGLFARYHDPRYRCSARLRLMAEKF